MNIRKFTKQVNNLRSTNFFLSLALLLTLFFSSVLFASAQNTTSKAKYWVFFEDKDTTNYDYKKVISSQTIQNRILQNLPVWQYSDIPVSEKYISKIQNSNADEKLPIITTSKWLNAVSIYLNEEELRRIQQLDFVVRIKALTAKWLPTQRKNKGTSEKQLKKEMGKAMEQLELPVFQENNLTGEGIVIGVIDAGFYGSHRSSYLKHLDSSRILGMRDWVKPSQKDLFREKETSDDDHGTTVLEMIGGFEDKENGKQVGAASEAKFYLARTDHGVTETRSEEDFWVAALEWMDSAGVKLINTSLGYSVGFDDIKENYITTQMDGKTSVVSKAAQIAFQEKGILLVVSAGNEGWDDWKIVSTPGDSPYVLSVGATNGAGLKMGYSSIGADFVDYLKPNVACYSLTGTSFSTPNITGFAACLWQKKPTATNQELFEVIEKSATLYPFGNNFIGYGIPKASLALQILEQEKEVSDSIKKIEVEKNQYKFEVPAGKRYIVFHKKDSRLVEDQNSKKISDKKDDKITIKRLENVAFTTIYIEGMGGFEIEWK